MDVSVLTSAFKLVFSPAALLLLPFGVLWGTVIGALPGLGGIVAVSMLLPFTYHLSPVSAISVLMGVFCGVIYGGSISSILMNTPGTPQAAATCLDGFPLAQQGKAGEAIGWATVSSMFGGLFSCAVLIIAGPLLAEYALYFGPVEIFALITMALTCIAGVSRGGMAKGLMVGCVGLFLGVVGVDPISGNARFTFNIFHLEGGIHTIPLFVGIFALAEVLSRAYEANGECRVITRYTGIKLPGWKDWKGRVGTLIKSALIGTGIGILPGVGADTAAFIGYAEARRTSRFKDKFGKGEPAGIIGPETANNAVTGGALVPSLALGIPGDPLTAIMLSTLILHGITPGVQLTQDNPDVLVSLFMLLFLANLLMLPVGMLVARVFSQLIRMPEPLLMAAVSLLCFFGVYTATSNPTDLWLALGFGIMGFLMRQLAIPAAPLAIGFVLSSKLEVSLRQGLLLNHNQPLLFFKSPIATILFAITALILLAPLLRKLWAGYANRRRQPHSA